MEEPKSSSTSSFRDHVFDAVRIEGTKRYGFWRPYLDEVYSMKLLQNLCRWVEIPFLGFFLLVYFWGGYFGVAALTLSREHYSVWLPVDNWFPYVPEFGIVYVTGYIVILFPPLLIRDMRMIRAGTASCIILMSLAYLCFILFPVRLVAPSLPSASLAAKVLNLSYPKSDHGMNCFPSLHVAMSCLCALSCFRVNKVIGLALQGLTFLIALSTLLIKRHYLLDIPAGYLLAVGVYYGFMERYLQEYVSRNHREK